MEDVLILVDDDDNEIGYNEKMDVHIKEQLHRAFSLFIYNKNEKKVLLHRRALGKYHSGGLWTNSCCSHPRRGEALLDAVIRRTKEELGFDIKCFEKEIIELGKFRYYKKFKNCAEYEIDHVFILALDIEPGLHINSVEIEEAKWYTIENINTWLKNNSDDFTVWFSPAYKMMYNFIKLDLENCN